MTYAFEDFRVGGVIEIGQRAVTAEEILALARLFDPQPFHLSAAPASPNIL